jgi:hypothetical protein
MTSYAAHPVRFNLNLDQLLARCRQGDAAAFTQLMHHYQARVYNAACAILRDEVAARGIRRAVIAHQRMSWEPEDRPYPIRVTLPSRARIEQMPRVGGAYLARNGRLLVVVRPSIVPEPL